MKKTLAAIALASAMMAFGLPAQAAEPIDPIEPVEVKNPALVELGKMLFFEPRLSRSGFISCNSCHNLATGGVDNLVTSIGDRWAQGPGPDQFADGPQLLRPDRPVLGRPCEDPRRTGRRPDRQPA